MRIFRQLRWSDGVYCPHCKSFKIRKRGFKSKTRRYSCNECGSNFSDFTGTIFARRRLSLGEVFYILANLDNKSVKRLSEKLGHSRSTIHFIAKEFREKLALNMSEPVLFGEIEIDETVYSRRIQRFKKNEPRLRGLRKRRRDTYNGG